MQDNKKLWIVVALMVVYGVLVWHKLADSSGLVVLITYAVKKLLDMHEDSQVITKPEVKDAKIISPAINPVA